MKLFENRKTKGAVSIFLVMILIPTMLLSAVLIDGSRLAAAQAITQEAADLAAMSVLTDYNQELKDEYGLFALRDSGGIKAIYKESLNATLLAAGMSAEEDYSERLWELLKSAAGSSNPYKGKSFFNMYDFSVDHCQVDPKYSLAEWQVLENQMVEYAKFRGIYVMGDRLELFNSIGNMKQQAEEVQVASGVMENKMDIDEKNGDVEKKFEKLRNSIKDLNESIKTVAEVRSSYLITLEAQMNKLRQENLEIPDSERVDTSQAANYVTSQSLLLNAIGRVTMYAGQVIRNAEEAERAVEAAIGRLDGFQAENNGSSNETVSGLVSDSEKTEKEYIEKYIPELQKLQNDTTLNRLKSDEKLMETMKTVLDNIDHAISRYEKELQEAEENQPQTETDPATESNSEGEPEGESQEEEKYYYYYLVGTDRTDIVSEAIGGAVGVGCYRPAVNAVIEYFEGKSWKEPNPSLEINRGQGSSAIDKNFAQSQSGTQGNAENNNSSAPQGTVDDAVYNARPSKTFQSEGGNKSNTNFYNEDGDLSASKNIINGGGSNSMLLQLGETARDDVLALSYMFGTFKTRMTGVGKFSASGMPESEKQSFYMPKWRYAHENGELDMRFESKKDRTTVLRSEIEYLVYGNKTDKANENGVYATIYAERLVNNMIALYTNGPVKAACHTAAAGACALTLGTVPEPVFFWIFLTAWAVAETTMDMKYLVDYGYKIPLLKTKDNILLADFPTGQGLVSNYGEKGLFITYEDYLLILLLIKGQNKRLMRSADLIEMNMKKKQSDFTMAEAYTYLEADSTMSIRYLFGSVGPFQQEYQNKGLTGRMSFQHHLYLGY